VITVERKEREFQEREFQRNGLTKEAVVIKRL
jgi:hypothetical protein